MKVLLTGSAGFVGRHLAAALPDEDLTCIDLVNGDDCLDFFRSDNTRFDLALHTAAVVGGRASIDGSPLAVATNHALDAWYFQWLHRSGTRKAVYFSSSAAYPAYLQGANAHRPLTESVIDLDFIANADATYGHAKLTGEILARHARHAGLDVLVVRPFSGYGEDQDLDYPFPSFIDRATRLADPFEIWGDGRQVRDWIHIDDVVAATLTAVRQNVAGPVNLCSGVGTSFTELAQMVCAAVGYDPSLRYVPSAPVGVLRRVGDPGRLRQFYTPVVTLDDGIERSLVAAAAKVGAHAIEAVLWPPRP